MSDEKKISLLDYHNGLPCGLQYLLVLTTAFAVECKADPDYPDLVVEAAENFRLLELNGTVDSDGSWCWDGVGDRYDDRGNSVRNIKAS